MVQVSGKDLLERGWDWNAAADGKHWATIWISPDGARRFVVLGLNPILEMDDEAYMKFDREYPKR